VVAHRFERDAKIGVGAADNNIQFFHNVSETFGFETFIAIGQQIGTNGRQSDKSVIEYIVETLSPYTEGNIGGMFDFFESRR